MLFSRALIDMWDPSMEFRNGDRRMSCIQIVTIPVLSLGLFFSFWIDVATLPWQLRMIYRDE